MRALLIGPLHAAGRLLRAGASLCGYAAAGALQRDDFERAIRAQWERYGRCSWSPSTGLLQWEADFYLAHLRAEDRILLVGCGSGRDLFPLVARGHEVDGLDIAADAVEACRRGLAERGQHARLEVGSIVDSALRGPYDAVILSWFCYSYVPERAARVRALERLRHSLAPGGRVLLSYIARPAAQSHWPVRAGRMTATLVRSNWRLEYGDCVVISGSLRAPTVEYEHRFEPGDVVAEAEAAGLRVLWHEASEDGRVVLVPVGH